jgi:hypothetical protein
VGEGGGYTMCLFFFLLTSEQLSVHVFLLCGMAVVGLGEGGRRGCGVCIWGSELQLWCRASF